MSLAVPSDMSPQHEASAMPQTGLMSLPGLTVMGLAMCIILTMRTIQQFMTTGHFMDPDDAMRISQARDFLNGQDWFDLMSYRLDAPHGVYMHWTRVLDVPIAILVRFFEIFAEPEMAERLMRLVLPMALLGGLFAVSIRISRLLVGPVGALAATLLIIFGGSMYAYFAPGRLDHDHLAVLVLVGMTGTLMRALDPVQTRAAALTGVIIAFNLSVSLETLPFLIMGVAALPACWIFHGQPMQQNLRAFALGLAGGLLMAFAATVPPARYLNGACDTLSAAHMVAGLVGAALCLALAQATPILPALGHRMAAAVAAGAITIASVYFTYPACLADPYANIDPVLRELWLDGVSEARPLIKAVSLHPILLQLLVIPTLFGLGGIALAIFNERGLARSRWIALGAIALAGTAASLWQVRATGVLMPLTLFGSVYLVTRVTGGFFARGQAMAVPATALAALLISPLFLGLVTPSTTSATEVEGSRMEFACRTQAAFAAIAVLPKSIILAPIDTGGHLLARTPHGVVAAPYHRNEHGNRLALDAFRANPEAAESIVRGAGVRYLAFCPGINDMELYRTIAPSGLGASLDDGKIPAWLIPLALDTPYKVFEVR